MIAGIKEHDKVHLSFSYTIILVQDFYYLFHHLAKVHNLLIHSLVHVNSFVEITKYEAVRVEYFLVSKCKLIFSSFEELIFHPFPLFYFNKSVAKDTHILMDPEAK